MAARIPRQFHFVFGLRDEPEPLHLVHYLCLASCLHVNRPDRIFFYCGHEPTGRYWRLIKPRLTVERVDRVPLVANHRYDAGTAPFRYAHHSDFVRMDKLVERGGVYADLDTLFVRPFPAALFDESFVLGREADIRDPNTGQITPSLCNALMMSAPGAPFGVRWRDAQAAAFDGTWSNHSTLLPQRLSEQHPDEVHVEPERSFYGFPASTRGLTALFDDYQPLDERIYSIHLWAHLWWSERRLDFTTFHAGLMTEDFVRDVDTTYNVAARQFLPPPREPAAVRPAIRRARRSLASGRERVGRVRQHTRAAAKLLVARAAPAWLLPRREGHALNARRELAFAAARRRFTFRNGFEKAILAEVVLHDAYRILEKTFRPDDVILDVGAHTGAFSYLCHRRGSRAVHAFEPDADNAARLRAHLSGLGGVTIHQAAVFRSDVAGSSLQLRHSGYVSSNTGAGTVVMGGARFSVLSQEVFPAQSGQGSPVPAIGLDDILSRFDRIAFLKLDCEGSEFPILLTSRLLGRVDRLAGEFHEVSEPLMSSVAPDARIEGLGAWRVDELAAHLEAAGFRVSIARHAPTLGLFTAERR